MTTTNWKRLVDRGISRGLVRLETHYAVVQWALSRGLMTEVRPSEEPPKSKAERVKQWHADNFARRRAYFRERTRLARLARLASAKN